MDEKLMPRIDFTGYCKDKYIIDLGKYEIKEENGKTYAVRKFEYPNTYEECCNVLDIHSDWHLTLELNNPASCDLCVTKEFEYVLKLEAFRKLIICRDAYWKLIGENMGLDKHWEPDWNGFGNPSYPTIVRCNNRIIKTSLYTNDCILVFPTEEIRDAFYENFKELIEQCKELL